ncbi:MAG: hypothetical protein PWQ67_2594 [Clostridia bacterium]|nr:hypothetical protein [Clostridia bacterium]
MIEAIKQLKDAGQKLFDSNQVLSITLNNENEFRLMVKNANIIDILAKTNNSEVKIEKRNSEDFPWEISTIVHGVTIFDLLERSELVEYAQKNIIDTEILLTTMNAKCPGDVGASTEGTKENISASL